MTASTVEPLTSATSPRPTPLWRSTWRGFRRKPMAMLGVVVIVVVGTLGLLAPVIAPYRIDQMGSVFLGSFSMEHTFGTDATGFDTYTRLLFGIRTSLFACMFAVSLALVGGVLIGVISGYIGGKLDTMLMRTTDAVMALPGLLMAMAVVGIRGTGVFNAMLGLSIAFMPGFARLTRGQVLAVKEESFVEAAQVIGAGRGWIVRKHVLPNIASPLIVQALMSMGFALLAEGALAYIGLSVQPPDASLGSLLQQGFTLINATPRLILVPGITIVLLSASFNAVADGIRDSLGERDTGPAAPEVRV